jgi:DNA replication protein
MKGFSGFPQKGRITKVPGLFFSDLLPQIDSLAELKVTLYAFWRLQQKEGTAPYLRRREILADDLFMSGLAPRAVERPGVLDDGLERAVARGTLLHVHVASKKWEDDLYFVNTARGRAAVEGIEQGRWLPGPDPDAAFDLSIERPNIYTLYEQNVGPLTPLIADSLRDLEATYPADWIEDAIKIAVEQNVRKLPYVEAVLSRWQSEGRADDEQPQSSDGSRYISGKYRDEIEF